MTAAGIFNASDQVLVIDEAGHMLEPGGFLSTADAGGDLSAKVLARHLDAERLVKVSKLPADYEPRNYPEPEEAEPVDQAAAGEAAQGDASDAAAAADQAKPAAKTAAKRPGK